MGRNFAGRVIPTIESTQLALVLKEPLGVVAAIVPWNYPLLLLAWKLAPALAAGDPLAPGTDLGPMVSEKVAAQVEAAVTEGAELVTGGDDGGQGTGHFYAPTVITGAPAQTDLLREETFGPVAPIVPVASLDEAIALANSTRFGLGANVYTRDLETVVRCMREIKAGTVWFNDPLTDNDAGPFGGYKQSGLGRELGQEGLEAFQETKHVHIETKIAAKSWWYPYGTGA
jgi:acyl-CoA reductase-like NAD-dependent aldehyde dehydrogenase